MSQKNTNGKYYLGRKIIDSYGRTLGKVVGYYSMNKNSTPIIGLELVGGIFKTVPSSHIIDEANVLVLNENWKINAENLSQNLKLNRRKTSALSKLYKSGEISQQACENLGKDFDATIQDLEAHREDLLDRLSERSIILEVKLKEVEKYFVNIKVSHELGEMDDEAYRKSQGALHDLINRLHTEQKDITAVEESFEQKDVTAVEESFEQNSIPVDAAEHVEKPLETETKSVPTETPIILKIEEAEK